MSSRRDFLASTAGVCGAFLGARGIARAQDALGPLVPNTKLPAGPGTPKEVRPGDPSVKEAYFWEPAGPAEPGRAAAVRCGTCPHGCILQPGETGICRAKRNLGGKHYSLSYGNPCAVNVDPVEKKPLFHFLPGTKAFSLAVAGCNFRCLNCQNWEISQVSPLETRNYDLSPEQVVALARRYACPSLAFTYSEPTSFYEYGVDVSSLGRAGGLRSVWVSNGYIRREPLDRLCRSIDAAAVNLKSFEDRIYRDLNGGSLQPVLDTLVRMKENGVWLEVINLVIPTYTDDLAMIGRMCRWLVRNLGPDTPLHFSRFSPLYKLVHLAPTPAETLARARETALEAGLHYVYIGNIPGMAEDTVCPGCGTSVLSRRGYRILSSGLKDGRCACGRAIAGIWA